MNGDTTYTPIHLTLSNPQGHYLLINSLNVHETDNVESKSVMGLTKRHITPMEALMESLLITYGVGSAYTQP